MTGLFPAAEMGRLLMSNDEDEGGIVGLFGYEQLPVRVLIWLVFSQDTVKPAFWMGSRLASSSGEMI